MDVVTRKEFIAAALKTSTDLCVEWPFAVRKSSGYPAYSEGLKNYDAHRFVCEKAHGPAPSSMHSAAHKCNRRTCVNPRHLRWADLRGNMADAISAGSLRGGGRHRQRIFAQDVAYIRQSDKSLVCLAAEYQMEPAYIGQVRRGRAH